MGINLSRIGEEFVLWTTDEFGFAKLDDGYATGSSMLPQKKNPDIAELARGKAGRLIGDLTGFLATMKGLPLSYNRDHQEDKEPLFDAIDQIRLALGAVTGMIATATWVPERMQAAADAETTSATDLAEWLVQRGTPFREAHAVVGALVRRTLAGEGALRDLVAADPALGPDAAALVAPGVSVRRRTTPGGAGPGTGGRADRAVPRPKLAEARVQRLPPTFAERDATVVAPDLLNKLLARRRRARRGSPRSRPTRPTTRRVTRSAGRTPRNAPMFGPPGPLVRVLHLRHAPLPEPRHRRRGRRAGGADPRVRRSTASSRRRTTGPGRLTEGARRRPRRGTARRWPSCSTTALPPPEPAGVTPRIGITKAVELPRRWLVPGG